MKRGTGTDSEQHPEKGGLSGNGWVSYSSYDPRGHPGAKSDGPMSVIYDYDEAERLIRIREAETNRELKYLVYALDNNGSDKRKGKLQDAYRHNYVDLKTNPPSVLDLKIQEQYIYGGRGGRLSRVDQFWRHDEVPKESFTQLYSWNDYGDLEGQYYPNCLGGCAPHQQPRVAWYTYTEGWLTSVSGGATSISYHPNGMAQQVLLSNEVIETFDPDPHGLPRPARMHASHPGTGVGWDSQAYSYDGAGNITHFGRGLPTERKHRYDLLSRLVQTWHSMPNCQGPVPCEPDERTLVSYL